MKRYRIITGQAYDGCIPITVYWVQKREAFSVLIDKVSGKGT